MRLSSKVTEGTPDDTATPPMSQRQSYPATARRSEIISTSSSEVRSALVAMRQCSISVGVASSWSE